MAKIKLKYGNSKDRFGHKDLEANLAAGVKYSEILQYLKDNPKKLWSGNAKGKPGGLYELVKSKTKEDTAAANKAKAEAAQAEQLKIDEAAKVGGYTRVDDDDGYKEGIAFDKDGLAIKTYDGKTLKIGNLPGHRYDDSAYADIKIIDYDATIEGYNPKTSLQKLGIVKDNVYDSKGKIDGVEFKEPQAKRQDYSADSIRGDKKKEDYSKRGLTEKGGQIKEFKIGGEYKKIQTNKDGTLKRLTLTKYGKFKPTTDEYPTEIKSNSFSDKLEIGTGLKSDPITRRARMGSIKSKLANSSRLSKDTYITSGKTQLSIE